MCFYVGELFAQCPVESYPGVAVEQVLDSSRYFVIRIQEGGGKLDTRVCNAFYHMKLLDSSRYFVIRIQEGGGKLDTRVCNAFYYKAA